MKIAPLLAIPAMLLLAVCAASAGSIAPDLQGTMQLQDLEQEIPVIVSLSGKADLAALRGTEPGLRTATVIRSLKQTAANTQAPVKAFLASRLGKSGKMKSLWIINAIAATLPPQAIQELAQRPEVESVRLDATIYLPEVRIAEEPLQQALHEWNIDFIRAGEIWNHNINGLGIVVAIMDTGVDIDHPDLRDRWRGGQNSWFDPHGEHIDAPYDQNGHGTQVAGIILGGNASGQAIGVAPGSQWIGVKIFNDAGETALSTIHDGFQWILDPNGDSSNDDRVADIVNCSWGFVQNAGSCDEEFLPDLRALKAGGISVVFAAGNAGPDPSSDMSPANYPESFSVGMIDQDLNVHRNSSRGPSSCDGGIYPKVTAPGVGIYTCDLSFGGTSPDPYTYAFPGTSYAAAHVSGAMALLKSVFPDLEPEELEQALMDQAVDLGETGQDDTYGYGLIDVAAAYEALLLQHPAPTCFIGTAAGISGNGKYEISFFIFLTSALLLLIKSTKGKRS